MINLLTPLNSLGYGTVGRGILRALSDITDVALWAIGPIEAEQADVATINKALRAAELFHDYDPCLKIWHQFDLAQRVGNGMYAAMPIFELNQFNDVETHHLKSVDKILVTSGWAQAMILGNDELMFKETSVVPLGVDTSIFYPRPKSEQESATTFLNMGKWEVRKGHDVLVKAFNAAFSPADDVKLIMHCFNPCFQTHEEVVRYNKEWTNLYKGSKLGSKIHISEGRYRTQEEVAILMSTADCGIFPSRAEGWNLELLEMLAMGKDVIATDYSAHTEFLNNENGRLLKVDKLETAYDGVWFKGQGEWAAMAEPQIEQLVEHMRAIHRGEKKLNRAGIETAERFTWANTAARIKEILC